MDPEPAYGFVSPTIINSDNKNFRKEAGDGHQFNPPEAQRLLKLGMEELGITEKPKLTMLIYDDKRKKSCGSDAGRIEKQPGVGCSPRSPTVETKTG